MNEVEITITGDDLSGPAFDSAMRRMAALRALAKALKTDINQIGDPKIDSGKISGSLQAIKAKIQSLGIADIADVNIPTGRLTTQLQVLKRLIQQAGISDLLDVNVNPAALGAQLDKLSNLTENVKIGIADPNWASSIFSTFSRLAAMRSLNWGVQGPVMAAGGGPDTAHNLFGSFQSLAAQAVLMGQIRNATLGAVGAMSQLAQVEKQTGDVAKKDLAPLWVGGGGWGGLGGSLALFGGALGGILPRWLAFASGWHLLIEGAIEFAAVAIPALIAAGSWAAASAGNFHDMFIQMQNINTAATAFNKNIPTFSGAWQALQNKVLPQDIALVGDAIDIVNKKGGAFSQMALSAGSVIDKLGARFTLAATDGHGFSAFLRNSVPDLAKFGDIVGNLGGAIGNIIKETPGIAERLLTIADAISKVIEIATRLAGPVINAGLWAHGLFLYAGLATTGLVALGRVAISTGNYFSGLWDKFGGIGAQADAYDVLAQRAATARLALFGFGQQAVHAAKFAGGDKMALGEEAAAMSGLGVKTEAAASKFGFLSKSLAIVKNIPIWGWVAVGVAVLGSLVAVLVSVQNGWDKLNTQIQTNIQAQTNWVGVTKTFEAGMASYRQIMNVANGQVPGKGVAAPLGGNLGVDLQAIASMRALNSERQIAVGRMTTLTKAYGSQGAAVSAVTALNLKLGNVLTENHQQWLLDKQTILGYLQGLTTLAGFTGGPARAAQLALGYAVNDQTTAMQQAVKAETGFFNVMVAGEQAFTSFMGDLRQSAPLLAKHGANVGGLTKNSLALANAYWSSLLPAAQTQIATLQSEFVSTTNLTTAVADISKQLVPYAQHNVAARTAIVGLINNALGPGTVSLKNLNSWIERNSGSLRGFKAIVDKAEVGASQLAKGLQSQLNKSFEDSLLKSSGADKMMAKYTDDIVHNRQNTAAGRADRAQLIRDLEASGLSAKRATAYVDSLSRSVRNLHGKNVSIGVNAIQGGSTAAWNVILGRPASYGLGVTVNPPSGGGGGGGGGSAKPRAGGGWAGGLTLAGEMGPEILRLPGGTGVNSAVATRRMFANLGNGGYGSGCNCRVTFDVTGADADMKAMIRKMVRIDGGSSSQDAFGSDDL